MARTIASGVWTTERRYALAEGTRLRLIEVAQYHEGTCAGSFVSSVGRYEVLGAAPGEVAEITHCTARGDDGTVIAEHPDVARLREASGGDEGALLCPGRPARRRSVT